mmetsp:Transcript_24643/g.38078  ORF Transcript_24643/g.38078 Transcript_24643/m.38078 type:complete len:125 (-) Transcript_24643:134-508(-)
MFDGGQKQNEKRHRTLMTNNEPAMAKKATKSVQRIIKTDLKSSTPKKVVDKSGSIAKAENKPALPKKLRRRGDPDAVAYMSRFHRILDDPENYGVQSKYNPAVPVDFFKVDLGRSRLRNRQSIA